MTAMPRKNRVTPFATLEAVSARGLLMGNRGDLHLPDGRIGRTWKNRAWISCTLSLRPSGPVPFDTPGHYTPLFFHDEAVALAAGHRPCALCRRDSYRRFRSAFARALGMAEERAARAGVIDAALHADRIEGRAQRRFRADIGDLPDFTFVLPDHLPDQPHLLSGGRLMAWSHAGYQDALPMPPSGAVDVLTPRVIVAILKAGYTPWMRT